MSDQSPEPMADINKPSAMVPYERFSEVNQQLKMVKAELADLKLQLQQPDTQQEAQQTVTEEDIFKRMLEDPQGYLSELTAKVVQSEMGVLREQLELATAMRFARHKYPEFKAFEGHILQEIMHVLDSNSDLENQSWESLIDNGFKSLQEKFKAAVKNSPQDFLVDNIADLKKSSLERSGAKKHKPLLPSFSRDEIARMSLEEFMKHETAINDALKNNRIQ